MIHLITSSVSFLLYAFHCCSFALLYNPFVRVSFFCSCSCNPFELVSLWKFFLSIYTCFMFRPSLNVFWKNGEPSINRLKLNRLRVSRYMFTIYERRNAIYSFCLIQFLLETLEFSSLHLVN